MHERDHRDGHARASRRRRRVWLIAISSVVLAAAGWLLWMAVFPRGSRAADERLAEIEAARAIPDSENAATIYHQLLQDPNATSILDDLLEAVEAPALERGLSEPWSSTDHLERAAWVERHRVVMDRLLNAAERQSCRFPLQVDILADDSPDRFAPMLAWEYLLSLAANNDIAEGRIDAAIIKWRCLIQLANHLRQQPLLLDHVNADYLPTLALESMARLIIAGDPTETHLDTMERLPLPLTDDWETYRQEMQTVSHLQTQRLREQSTLVERLRSHLRSGARYVAGRTWTSTYDEARNRYLYSVARARVVRILIALKRQRTAAQCWPQSLNEIKASLSPEVLTDPISEGPFVYRPGESAFVLYSRGKNGIDEHGRQDPDSGADDWPIWPPREPHP